MPKQILLPLHLPLTQEIIEKLDDLMGCSSARTIRNSLLEVYQQYIIHNHEALPVNFDEIASDFYMLIDFFTQLEEERSA